MSTIRTNSFVSSIEPALAHRPRALIPAREREPSVAAELVELPAEIADAGADVALIRAGRPHAEKHHVDELPRLGEELHDADRTDVRDDVLLEARLHPGERPRERGIDAVDARPVVDRGANRVTTRRRSRGGRRRQPCTLRKREALIRHDDVRQLEPVAAGEPPGADVVARRDREEALARLDDVPGRRGDVTGQRAIRPRAGDAVGDETASTLVAAQRDARAPREPPVDGSAAEPVAAKAELEHRDVPAHGAHAELALSEKRPAACAERTPRRAADAPRRAARLVLAGTRSEHWS